jgi:hypothetical protein
LGPSQPIYGKTFLFSTWRGNTASLLLSLWEETITVAEINWNKITNKPIFLRENVSWRRMLPIQFPIKDDWYISRGVGDPVEVIRKGLESTPLGWRPLSPLFDDIRSMESDPSCLRTRTQLLQSEESGDLTLCISFLLKPITPPPSHVEPLVNRENKPKYGKAVDLVSGVWRFVASFFLCR